MLEEEKVKKERPKKVSLHTACSLLKMSSYSRGAVMKYYQGEDSKTLDRWKEIFRRDKLI